MSINLLSMSKTMTAFTVLMSVFIALILVAAFFYYKLYLQKRGGKEEKPEEAEKSDEITKAAVKDEISDEKTAEFVKNNEKSEPETSAKKVEAEKGRPNAEAKEDEAKKPTSLPKRGKKKKTPKFVIIEDKPANSNNESEEDSTLKEENKIEIVSSEDGVNADNKGVRE